MKNRIVTIFVSVLLMLVSACTPGSDKDPNDGTSGGTTETKPNQTITTQLDVNKTINQNYQDFTSKINEGRYIDALSNYVYISDKNKNGKYNDVITLMNNTLSEQYSILSEIMFESKLSQNDSKRLNDFKVFANHINGIIERATDGTMQSYLDGDLDYESAYNYLQNTKIILPDYKQRDQYLTELPAINQSKTVFEQGLALMENTQYRQALDIFKSIGQNQYYYEKAVQKIIECDGLILSEYVDEINALIISYNYDKAIDKADEYLIKYPGDVQLTKLKEDSQKSLSELYAYTGPLYHIFFHSLIVYPEKAFDGDFMQQGYNYWMTTVDECKKILEQLYERNYVLYDIRKLITTNSDGSVTKNKIMVPKGKKPIILSIDDVSYYDYMKNDGFAQKLIIDENGKLANYTIAPDGTAVISREHDVMPLVDKFVEEHPDFSFQGAKGVLALTGYEGVLGYRTNNPDEKDPDEIKKLTAQAKEVADAMKANGWLFACHSYTHANTFSDGVFALDYLKYDTERWKKEVVPIIGETNIYITPFGYHLKPGSESYNYAISEGFNILCAVGGMPYVSYTDKAVVMDRQNLERFYDEL